MKRMRPLIVPAIALAWACLIYGLFFRHLGATLPRAIKHLSGLPVSGKLLGLAAFAFLLIVGVALWRKRPRAWLRSKIDRLRPILPKILGLLAIGLVGIALAYMSSLDIGILTLVVRLGLIELMILLLLVTLGFAFGHTILNLTGVGFSSNLEEVVFSVGLGIGALAYLVFVQGLLGLLYKPVLISVLVGLGIVLLPDTAKAARRLLKALPPKTRLATDELIFAIVIVSILVAFTTLNYVCALAPETEFDGLSYHLAVPQIYIVRHKITDIPDLWRSHWAFSQEMLYTLGLLLHGERLAKLFHFFMGIWTALTVFSFCQTCLSWKAGLLASAIFCTVPIVSYEMTTAYNELALTMYGFLAWYAGSQWFKHREQKWLTVTGLFSGFALGTKYLGIFTLIGIIAGLCFWFAEARWGSWRFLVRKVLWLGAVSILVALPWYVKNLVYTGNPVFPFLNNLFRSPLWMVVAERTDLDTYGLGRSLAEFVAVPWDLTFQGPEFGGIIGPVFLAFVPIALWRARGEIRYLLMASVTLLALWFFSASTIRYFIPALPLLSIGAAHAARQFANFPGRVGRIALVALLGLIVLGMALNFPTNIPLWQREGAGHIITRFPLPVVLGRESEEGYLSKHVLGYDVYKFLRVNVASSARVFTLGAEFQYLCP